MENTTYTVNGQSFELRHYGVKGMKWGRRKNVYDINAAYYNKRAAKLDRRAQVQRTMGSMQRAASKSSSGLLSKATAINANYYEKRAAKLTSKANKNRTMATLNAQASARKSEAAAERRAKAKKSRSTGNKAVQKAMRKVGSSTIRNSAKVAGYGAQFVGRMIQTGAVIAATGYVFDSLYDR